MAAVAGADVCAVADDEASDDEADVGFPDEGSDWDGDAVGVDVVEGAEVVGDPVGDPDADPPPEGELGGDVGEVGAVGEVGEVGVVAGELGAELVDGVPLGVVDPSGAVALAEPVAPPAEAGLEPDASVAAA